MSGGDSYLFKVVIMGEKGVGKSSLMLRFCDGTFSVAIASTNGVADRKKEITIGERKVTLNIWDTAGQERFRGINRQYYRNAKGAILVFDTTELESLNKLNTWIEEFKQEGAVDAEFLLVGTKIDMVDKRQVSVEMARSFALRLNMNYIETSAKDGLGVTEAFHKLGDSILAQVLCGGACNDPGSGSKLSKNEKSKKSGCC